MSRRYHSNALLLLFSLGMLAVAEPIFATEDSFCIRLLKQMGFSGVKVVEPSSSGPRNIPIVQMGADESTSISVNNPTPEELKKRAQAYKPMVLKPSSFYEQVSGSHRELPTVGDLIGNGKELPTGDQLEASKELSKLVGDRQTLVINYMQGPKDEMSQFQFMSEIQELDKEVNNAAAHYLLTKGVKLIKFFAGIAQGFRYELALEGNHDYNHLARLLAHEVGGLKIQMDSSFINSVGPSFSMGEFSDKKNAVVMNVYGLDDWDLKSAYFGRYVQQAMNHHSESNLAVASVTNQRGASERNYLPGPMNMSFGESINFDELQGSLYSVLTHFGRVNLGLIDMNEISPMYEVGMIRSSLEVYRQVLMRWKIILNDLFLGQLAGNKFDVTKERFDQTGFYGFTGRVAFQGPNGLYDLDISIPQKVSGEVSEEMSPLVREQNQVNRSDRDAFLQTRVEQLHLRLEQYENLHKILQIFFEKLSDAKTKDQKLRVLSVLADKISMDKLKRDGLLNPEFFQLRKKEDPDIEAQATDPIELWLGLREE